MGLSDVCFSRLGPENVAVTSCSLFCCSFDTTPGVNSVLKVWVYLKIYFCFSDTFVQLYQTFSDIVVQFVHLRNLSSACCGPGLLPALECKVPVLSELSACESIHTRETHVSVSPCPRPSVVQIK